MKNAYINFNTALEEEIFGFGVHRELENAKREEHLKNDRKRNLPKPRERYKYPSMEKTNPTSQI
jgi:hypothetical protein